jgi:hypothetical protein
MAEDGIREKPGDGADIEQWTLKLPGSDVSNGVRQPVNISPKNVAMSASIARRDAYAKADIRIPIAVLFGRASTETKTGILISPTIPIPNR